MIIRNLDRNRTIKYSKDAGFIHDRNNAGIKNQEE